MSEYQFVERSLLTQLDSMGWTVIDQGAGMIEIKGENMIDHPTVKAKQEYAEMIAKASDVSMSYELIPGN